MRPTQVETVSLGLETHALPAALANDTTLSVALTPAGDQLLVGGQAGLYTLGSSGFTRVSTGAISGLASSVAGSVVARAGALEIYSGALEHSPLTEIVGHPVTALANRGSDIWIGTAAGLFIYTGGHIQQFEGMDAVKEIAAFDGTSAITVRDGADQLRAIHIEGTNYSLQSLSEERAISAALPGPSGRLFGLDSGALVERVKLDTVAAWRAVSLSSTVSDPVATGVEAWTVDPTSGAVWVVRSSVLARLDSGGHVSLVQHPVSLGRVQVAKVTADGALWLSDGTNLLRVGDAGPPPGYAASIVPFYQANCAVCHSVAAGIGRPSLDTYEDWSTNVARIIAAVQEGRMPNNGRQLTGGTVDLIKKWRDGGLRR